MSQGHSARERTPPFYARASSRAKLPAIRLHQVLHEACEVCPFTRAHRTIRISEGVMKRRAGLRARTDFEVTARHGSSVGRYRGIEVSAGGIVVDWGRGAARPDASVWHLELRLPERLRVLRATARPVWTLGTCQALRFVSISDVDRLSIAEHVDLQGLRGIPLA
jgi:hypothetical protein